MTARARRGPPGLIDARTLSPGTRVACDVCVVGTGAAGATLALGMAGRGYRVCVLEAGGRRSDRRGQARCAVETAGLPLGPQNRVRALGGTTNVWSGKLARLDPIDLEERPWVAGSGWPLGYDELAHHYDRAAALLGWPDHAAYATDQLRPSGGRVFDGPELQTAVFQRTRRPTNFGALLRRQAGTDAALSVYLYAAVSEIVLTPGQQAVSHVHVTTAPGRTWKLAPRVVVLAAGAIENARLLLASDRQCPNGVGNARDQVGRYYMDHPKATAGLIVADDTGAGLPGARLPDPTYWGRARWRGATARWGLRLSASAQADRGVLNSHVFLDPVHAGAESAAVVALKALYSRKRTGTAALAALRLVADDPGAIAAFLKSKATGTGTITGFELTTFSEQPPLATNRVTLSDDRDDLGCRRAKVDWSISELERRSAQALHAVIAAEVRRCRMGTLHSPLLDAAGGAWPRFRDASHHAGTTRMGTDPATSVVDPQGQVHGIENLFVAGGSVFPTVGYANPTFTIVALTLRLAGEVARRLARPVPAVSPAPPA